MANLITAKGLGKAYGARMLFRNIHLSIATGERIGLVGPNGAGKSTLLRIVCGVEDADEGQVVLQKLARVSYLAQADVFDEAESATENLLASLAALAEVTETEKLTRVQTLLSLAGFREEGRPICELSGGWRKRLAICRALLVEPDVLVMDEPTNHLDIEGILWLESILNGTLGVRIPAFLLVSHDRRFLENSTNRVMELSAVYPDGIFRVDGNYSRFLEERATFLALQSQEEERLANKVRRETEWLRRGPKARATKARYRIEEAGRLQEELSQVKGRNRATSRVQIDFEATGRKTKKLLEGVGLAKSYGERQLFSGLDILLSPSSRVGLLGRNGCGKSTVMQILAAAASQEGIRADSGTLFAADGIRIVNFDQRREQIDPEITLRRALAPDGDAVVYMGRSLHVVSWAKKFLFRPDQLETPVGQLSGGEQARILVASLMRQPADILLLDEPTNDLDIPSLDVLEESLQEFPGALVLVTHDRYLLDAVCDRILGFDGEGAVAWYADYEQWLEHIQENEKAAARLPAEKSRVKEAGDGSRKKEVRLSYMEQREYDRIEEQITSRELDLERLEREMQLPDTISDPARLAECWQNLENTREEIDRLYARWAELEDKRSAGSS
jgi:ATP-binding cassette subfamily F protein uup